jgi:hypothetical protein
MEMWIAPVAGTLPRLPPAALPRRFTKAAGGCFVGRPPLSALALRRNASLRLTTLREDSARPGATGLPASFRTTASEEPCPDFSANPVPTLAICLVEPAVGPLA